MNHQSRPFRIAFVASSLELAGAEKQVFYMARALHRAGIEVHFFYLGSGGYYERLLREAGVSVHQIYVPNRPWLMLARLTKTLCGLRPQIVLAAQFGDLRYAAPVGRLCHALVLGGIRSDGLYELNAHGRLSGWLAQSTHGLVANSCRATQNLVFRGIKPQKIEVLPNVIDVQDFDRQSVLPSGISVPPDRIIVAAVGSLQPCKRFDRFLEALALARRSEPALTGVIAGGDCGVYAELQARARALGLMPHFASHHVVFLGEMDRVPALLTQAAFLVLTSDYEGFPNVILEAMAARSPVISVPAGDAGLIVQDGKTGYVVEADDTRTMAEVMVQLAHSPERRRDLGEAGRKRVEQEYHCEPLAERLVGVFHRFASQNRRTSLCEWLEHNFATKRAKNRQVFGRDGRDNATWHLKLDGQQSRPHQNGTGAPALQDAGVASQTPSDSLSQSAIENRGTTHE
ncbi:MAG TPA: glycosyltransferase family 4 protein [Candidatus Acidoferrum sp.]|nr:glycosyltransferase family 4 protein [Candidatus Acidoferrum sp.]